MIILIRGTNGSGKSWVVRQIIKRATSTAPTPIDANHGSSLIRLPDVRRDVFVVGPYTEGRSMGGSDTMQHRDIFRVMDAALENNFHILVENVLIAGRWFFEASDAGEHVHLCFIDPPLKVCRERIALRQALNNRKARVSQEAMVVKQRRASTMYEKAEYTWLTRSRFEDSKPVVPHILKLLRSA